jgi:hypothetical protein
MNYDLLTRVLADASADADDEDEEVFFGDGLALFAVVSLPITGKSLVRCITYFIVTIIIV